MSSLAHLKSAGLDRVRYLGDLIRWDEWYNSKIPLVFLCIYYAALCRPELGAFFVLGETARLLAVIIVYASFGFLVNSYSDRQVDVEAGKPNPLAAMTETRARLLVAVVALVGLAGSFLLYLDRVSVFVVTVAAYLVAAAYSLAPVRLKERDLWGLVAGGLAQRTFPALIVFQAMAVWDAASIAICCMLTMMGIRFMAIHQAKDRESDLRARVKTVATTRGVPFLKDLTNLVLLPLELIALTLSLVFMARAFPALVVLVAFYIWLFLVKARFPNEVRGQESIFSYSLFVGLYYVYWPLFLALLLTWRDPAFVLLALVNVLWCFSLVKNAGLTIAAVATAFYARFGKQLVRSPSDAQVAKAGEPPLPPASAAKAARPR